MAIRASFILTDLVKIVNLGRYRDVAPDEADQKSPVTLSPLFE
jgi:hypothetical protein